MNKNIINLYYNKLFIILLGLVVYLSSGSVFYTFNSKILYLNFGFAMVLIFPLTKYLAKNTRNIISVLFLVFAITIISKACLDISNGMYYIEFLSKIILGFTIVILYDFEDVVNVFLKVMTVVTIISIIGYFIVNNTSIMDKLPVYTNINGIEYGVGIIFNYIKISPDRNCAIFWEPGVFATYLVFAILFETIFKKKKISIFRLIIFSIGIFTAKSSAGYMLWFFCMIIFLMLKVQKNRKNIITHFVLLIIFLLSLVLVINLDKIISNTSLANNYFFSKLLRENISNSSRIYAVRHNLQLFMSNPIIGVGLSEVASQIKYVADTSSSTFLMSVYGFGGITYTLAFILGSFKLRNMDVFVKSIFLVIIICIINKEPQFQFVFTWSFLFYLLKKESKIEEEVYHS